MKRIISAGLCTAFILSLAGCARQDTTPSLTAADTTDTQMGRWVESRAAGRRNDCSVHRQGGGGQHRRLHPPHQH